MARDEAAMSSERLAEIRRKQSKAWLNGDPWQADYRFDVADLLAEVERLRAREAAQGQLVELLAAEAWHGHNAPYYAEMRRILEAHKRAWHTLSESKQRSGGDGA